VTEPVKGAKAGGIKGAFKGMGKGIMGLFLKPVAGSVAMMSYTTQGINNTPGTIASGIKNMRSKKKKGQSEAEESKGNPNEPESTGLIEAGEEEQICGDN
jgi:hypothetical protein